MARSTSISAGLLMGVALLGASAPALADPVAEFYNGKRLRMVIGYSTGGGYDAYARLLARFISKHIPGAPVFVIQNMPGAGGIIAANSFYHTAPRDGSAIAMIGRNLPFQALMK